MGKVNDMTIEMDQNANPDGIEPEVTASEILEMKMMIREELVVKLREGTCKVVFKKVNGEERNMKCTLRKEELPDLPYKMDGQDAKPKRAVNVETISAWDVEKQAFRSFRLDNLISFSDQI